MICRSGRERGDTTGCIDRGQRCGLRAGEPSAMRDEENGLPTPTANNDVPEAFADLLPPSAGPRDETKVEPSRTGNSRVYRWSRPASQANWAVKRSQRETAGVTRNALEATRVTATTTTTRRRDRVGIPGQGQSSYAFLVCKYSNKQTQPRSGCAPAPRQHPAHIPTRHSPPPIVTNVPKRHPLYVQELQSNSCSPLSHAEASMQTNFRLLILSKGNGQCISPDTANH